jgi:hypothetical protein
MLGKGYESSFFGAENLYQMQDHQAQGSGSRDLREPQAQATARLNPVASGQWLVPSQKKLATRHCS